MGNEINGQTQNVQAKSLQEAQENAQKQLDAKKLNDFNALVSKLTQ